MVVSKIIQAFSNALRDSPASDHTSHRYSADDAIRVQVDPAELDFSPQSYEELSDRLVSEIRSIDERKHYDLAHTLSSTSVFDGDELIGQAERWQETHTYLLAQCVLIDGTRVVEYGWSDGIDPQRASESELSQLESHRDRTFSATIEPTDDLLATVHDPDNEPPEAIRATFPIRL